MSAELLQEAVALLDEAAGIITELVAQKTNTEQQTSFSFNSDYSSVEELITTFKSEILDQFEQVFLNFSKISYDMNGEGNSYKENFHLLLKKLLLVDANGINDVNIVKKSIITFTIMSNPCIFKKEILNGRNKFPVESYLQIVLKPSLTVIDETLTNDILSINADEDIL